MRRGAGGEEEGESGEEQGGSSEEEGGGARGGMQKGKQGSLARAVLRSRVL